MKIFYKTKKNKGATLVELVVVLAIFALLSSVVIYNYGGFQTKIDLQNLTSQIALQVAQAQSSALSGQLTSKTVLASWKPTYGVYFSSSSSVDASGGDNKDFIYFADISGGGQFDGQSCNNPIPTNYDCITKYTLTKGNTISTMTTDSGATKTNLTISFTRPSSGATFYSGGVLLSGVSYVQITVLSPKGVTANIRLYQSGRIQII